MLDFSSTFTPAGNTELAEAVEVQELDAGFGAAFEEAAVLYASGNASDAEQVLESVLEVPDAQIGEGVWMMLLDLYRLTGQRERFENRVLDYATRFERSPPPWRDLSSGDVTRARDKTPIVNLGGVLGAQAESQFQQICVIGRKSGAIHIDLKRLRGVDDAGCRLFVAMLQELGRDRVRFSIRNCESFADVLAEKAEVGVAANQDVWLLLMEMLQYCNDEARFEQTAIDYAITFEVSPPSWENRGGAMSEAEPPDAVADDVDDGLQLAGEITSSNNDQIRKLAADAEKRDAMVVDCRSLRRLDFASAGTLFSILATLTAQGKQVHLTNVNTLVGALMRVMGVDKVARVDLAG